MSHLLEPLKVGTLTLANRLIMPPMATSKAETDGKVSNAVLDYYAEKSLGGYISLIIIEHSFINLEGKASHQQLSVAEDGMVENLKKLADTIHQNGSKAVMQINHAGSAAKKEIINGSPLGPSAVPNPRTGDIPKELTIHEIQDIIKAFAQAARRAFEAGFDGVEIHSAHGYLLDQFYSPLTNKRTDEYGGDINNRIKIHLQIIKEVRSIVGEDFLVLLRLGVTDNVDGGITMRDSEIAAKEFEKAGVDILDISGGFCGFTISGAADQGYFSPFSEAIKKVVSIPVILTGGITEAAAAEQLLAEGKADLIGVGRAIYTDSNWAKVAISK
jgi:NADPH2 dehydrogenase